MTRLIAGLFLILFTGLAAAAMPGASPVQTDETRLALVISQGDYQGALSDLAGAADEADLIHATLNDLGFNVMRADNLTQAGLITTMNDFRRDLERAGPDAIGFIYYTGHGAQHPATQASYLLGTDADLKVASDLSLYGLDMAQQRDAFSATGAKAVFMVFDACRNVPGFGGYKAGIKGLARVEAKADMLIAYSTGLGDVAREGEYAPVLAEELRRPGVTAENAFAAAQRRVAARTDRGQLPWTNNQLYNEVCFAGCGGATFTEVGDRLRQMGGIDTLLQSQPRVEPDQTTAPASGGFALMKTLQSGPTDVNDPPVCRELRSLHDDLFGNLAGIAGNQIRSASQGKDITYAAKRGIYLGFDADKCTVRTRDWDSRDEVELTCKLDGLTHDTARAAREELAAALTPCTLLSTPTENSYSWATKAAFRDETLGRTNVTLTNATSTLRLEVNLSIPAAATRSPLKAPAPAPICASLGAILADLPPINFDSGRSTITADSATNLSKLADSLAQCSGSIAIGAHTDSAGAESANQTLTAMRASAVRDYLITQGIDASRIYATGYGETSPIADNSTAAGRAKNRRVEIKLVQ